MICAPLLGVAFLVSLIIKHYPYTRATAPAPPKTGGAKEKESPADNDDDDKAAGLQERKKDLDGELEQEDVRATTAKSVARPDARVIPDPERA